MSDLPLVCICIPNFNNATTLPGTLDSLINQTYKNIIIQVFDNASTDNSLAILEKYIQKYENIKVFKNSKNIGGEANFSKCIQNMIGDYSAIYHSDDVYMPTIVEEEVNALANENISAVFTGGIIIDEKGKVTGRVPIPKVFMNDKGFSKLSFDELIKSNLKYDNFLICPSAMTKTKIYKEIIKVWDGSKYKTAADIDVWLRFAELNNIGIITEPLIQYRLAESSFSFRRLKSRVILKDYFLVMDAYLSRVDVKKILSKNDYENYHFLKFKDHVVIEKNSIINGIITENQIKIDLTILKQAFLSPKKFICLCAAVVFNMINYNKLSSKLVQRFK